MRRKAIDRQLLTSNLSGDSPGHRRVERGRRGGSVAQSRLRETSLDDTTNPEILLVSAVVQTGDHTNGSLAGLNPEFFHSHRQEWEWLVDFLMKYGKVPDKATFRSRFPDFPLLRTTDVEHAAEAVENAHLRYQLTTTLRDATSKLVDDDPTEAMALMHSALAGVNFTTGTRESHADVLRDYSPILAEAQRRMDAASTLGYAGLSFGFPTLNDRTGGMFPGDLVIWAARLGQGKTWFLCRVVAEACSPTRRSCSSRWSRPERRSPSVSTLCLRARRATASVIVISCRG